MKTLILEDEPGPRTTLRNLIARHCPQLDLVGEADNLEAGWELIRRTQPELVFLDIRFPKGTAFDLLDRVADPKFQVIFITAHDEYAVEAFRYNAAHYLLKPFLPDELVEAVNRAQASSPPLANLKSLMDSLQQHVRPETIAVHSLSKITYVPVDELVRCESEGAYTHLFLESGERILSTQPLKSFDETLSPKGFLRIHRSHLINLSKVKEYRKNTVDAVILTDNSRLDISRKKRQEFLDHMALRATSS